jgi:hypothetical protein
MSFGVEDVVAEVKRVGRRKKQIELLQGFG